jgi:BASS family bile acid:Na+ symporter
MKQQVKGRINWKDYQFTAWIGIAFAAGMLFPQSFQKIGGLELRNPWLLLIIIQLVMFGMGIQMKLKDFTHIRSSGKGLVVGLLSQFTIMPLVGFLLAKFSGLPGEVAAGMILLGSCSSGLASNVMVYIAKANLFLSVVLTAMATIAAPLLTPLLMKLLAGEMVQVSFVSMMFDILKIVIVPIGAGLLHDLLKKKNARHLKVVGISSILAALWLVFVALGGVKNLLVQSAGTNWKQAVELFSILCGGFLFGLLYHKVSIRWQKLDRVMPSISMAGIIYITLVTTAAGRDNLLLAGWILLLCAIIHNVGGFALGYWFSRLLGCNARDARTISLEVGLQNGAMASGLASSMGKLSTMGLAAAVFIPWMNIAGSLLANYWRRHPVEEVENIQLKHNISTSKISAE